MKIIVLSILLAMNYSFAQSQSLSPTEEEALITFKVSDYSEVPEEDAQLTITGIDTAITKKGITGVDGTFQILLPEGKKFKISVHKFGEDFDFEKPLDLPIKVGTIKFEQKLKIRIITEYVRTYTLDHVYFDSNKFDIKKESYPALTLLYNALQGNSKMKVEIAGHTDDVGDDKTNLQLSQKRADHVMKFLLEKGINQNRILAKGYGETSPVASNDEDTGRQKNRRTEVRVISE